MSYQSWQEALVISSVDGPTITASGAVTCIPTPSKITLPNNYFFIGRKLKIVIQGRISCAVTTPGTARFDIRLGGTVVYDTGALNLNVVAKSSVPFWIEIDLVCRAVGSGSATTFMGFGQFQSEAVVGSAANTAGGNGSLLAPVGAPAVGSGVDNTTALALDCFFTQTVSTGSMTVHQYEVVSRN